MFSILWSLFWASPLHNPREAIQPRPARDTPAWQGHYVTIIVVPASCGRVGKAGRAHLLLDCPVIKPGRVAKASHVDTQLAIELCFRLRDLKVGRLPIEQCKIGMAHGM